MHSLITSDEQQQHKIHYLNSTLLKGTAFEITLYADRLDLQQADTETFSWD
ncbi:hypothetical protein [Kingella negevensis]|uniref:hypothetical protein n=1 Tax=Kingella negevensis TaxID=1522312 RepID=UPI00254CC52A|nr:hypothetical protein [Kingella negevensis]MDK4689763.1 hypothetical protein [Kingella negevensis]